MTIFLFFAPFLANNFSLIFQDGRKEEERRGKKRGIKGREKRKRADNSRCAYLPDLLTHYLLTVSRSNHSHYFPIFSPPPFSVCVCVRVCYIADF